MGVLDDPFARPMLAPSMASICWFVERWPYRLRARSLTLAGLTARVSWFDAQVAQALDADIEQIAIVGAGYDSRAWRMRRDGVQFFELDHEETQADKMRRAPGPGPTYVEADLRAPRATTALHGGGLDPTRPALFVVEGVTMYLTEEVVHRQLGDLAAASAAGSRLAVDFYPPRDAGTAQDRRQRRLQRMARAGSDESFRLVVDRAAAVELVEASGWHVDEVTTLRAAARAFVPSTSGLPVDAVNDHKTMIAASRS